MHLPTGLHTHIGGSVTQMSQERDLVKKKKISQSFIPAGQVMLVSVRVCLLVCLEGKALLRPQVQTVPSQCQATSGYKTA